ncbi:hypothetical protein CEUSTIGMA_g5669.t1 [Chlamydomonas eustigma]|uniref:Uncharacterized protein n=1 Tax=Chlamydomonas eustigma TaxID=1157962 RepID=A0A250X560_9CHLO|nr:hypothetical protein CEUSTIGMA_g5669.t1 [Chlamydomonas eustigma]|eukprot:GAX78227.1 hypothetical protein CEUSTIGMA_g5669.t1 [Chlamydomonas eustigma]
MSAAAIALIFALPSIRSAQPDIPPIGIVIYVGGFLWNELMCIGAASMLLAGRYGQYSYGQDLRVKYQAAHPPVQEAEVAIVDGEVAIFNKGAVKNDAELAADGSNSD